MFSHNKVCADINTVSVVILYFFGYKTRFLPFETIKTRSVLKDGSRSLGLFRKDKLVLEQNFTGLI